MTEKSKEAGQVDVKDLSFSDLYAMFMFVSADRNKGFSVFGADVKTIIDKKYAEIESELYLRTHGCNPFKSVVINGANPIDVVKSFKPEEKNFVVVKNEQEEKEEKTEEVVTFIVAKNE